MAPFFGKWVVKVVVFTNNDVYLSILSSQVYCSIIKKAGLPYLSKAARLSSETRSFPSLLFGRFGFILQ